MNKKLSSTNINYILESFHQNKTSRKLAEELNCSKTAILNIWKKNNLNKERISDDKIQYVINNYTTNIEIISDAIGLCTPTIRKLLKENNLFESYNKKIEKRNIIIKNDFFNGLSIKELSIRYGLVESQIRKIVDLKMNFTYRERSIISQEQRDYVLDNYKNNSSSQLTKIMGLNRNTITKIWHDNELYGKDNRQYYCDFNYFANIDNHDKAYIIGLLASDGCLFKRSEHQGLWQITLQEGDRLILEKISLKIQSDKPILVGNRNIKNKNHKNTCTLSINSDKMYNNLCDVGLFDSKTYYIKSIDLKIPNKYWKDYFRGYFDGDGSINIHKPKSNINITPTCYNINIVGFIDNLQGMQELLSKNLIQSKIIIYKRKCIKEFGSLMFSNTLNKYLFLKWIYSDIADSSLFLNRKYFKSKDFLGLVETNSSNKYYNTDAVDFYNKTFINKKEE